MVKKFRIKQGLIFLHNRVVYFGQGSNQMRIVFLLALLISSWLFTVAIQLHGTKGDRLQEGIAKEIIRFHVIANSDSDEDQRLKYQIKDALVEYLEPYLEDAEDIEEAQYILTEMLPFIKSVAARVIQDNDYNYSVAASLSSSYFPMKIYGDYTFPPGTYEALQVKIGDAKGKNWWCVMFPPLCFVDETYSIVDKDCNKKLKYLLTEEELNLIRSSKQPVKIRFKLFDSIKKLFD